MSGTDTDWAGIIELLETAPDTQLDASMVAKVKTWRKPLPTSLEVLEVVDRCIFSSLSNGLVLRTLQLLYEDLCKREGITHEHNEPLATWRDKL